MSTSRRHMQKRNKKLNDDDDDELSLWITIAIKIFIYGITIVDTRQWPTNIDFFFALRQLKIKEQYFLVESNQTSSHTSKLKLIQVQESRRDIE